MTIVVISCVWASSSRPQLNAFSMVMCLLSVIFKCNWKLEIVDLWSTMITPTLTAKIWMTCVTLSWKWQVTTSSPHVLYLCHVWILSMKQTMSQRADTICGMDGHGQTDRQTDRDKDRQTDGQNETNILPDNFVVQGLNWLSLQIYYYTPGYNNIFAMTVSFPRNGWNEIMGLRLLLYQVFKPGCNFLGQWMFWTNMLLIHLSFPRSQWVKYVSRWDIPWFSIMCYWLVSSDLLMIIA